MCTEAAGLPHQAGSNARTQLGELRMLAVSTARQLNSWACRIEPVVSDSVSRVPSEFPDLLIPPARPVPLLS